jgi:hypothetical protein
MRPLQPRILGGGAVREGNARSLVDRIQV